MPLLPILAPLAIAVALQALPTFSNLAATTLAPEILGLLELPGGAAGGYVFALYVAATLGSFVAASVVLRLGPIRAGQAALLFYVAGAGLIAATPSTPVFALAAIGFGLAYTIPIPAGAQILLANTPPHLRNTLFGIRQMGVPMGGLAAGVLYPPVAEAHGWQAAFVVSAVACLMLALALQPARRRYDADRKPGLPILKSAGNGPVAVLKAAPGMRRLGAAGMLYAGVEVTAVANIVLFLERKLAWSLIEAGYALGVLSVGGAVGRLFWGVAADRVGDRMRLLGWLGLGMAASMAVLAFGSAHAAALTYLGAFLVGFSAGGWTGVGVAESARLAGAAGAVAGAAALTQLMFLGVVTLPSAAGAALALGAAYPYVFASIGGLAGLGGLLLLTAPPEP